MRQPEVAALPVPSIAQPAFPSVVIKGVVDEDRDKEPHCVCPYLGSCVEAKDRHGEVGETDDDRALYHG